MKRRANSQMNTQPSKKRKVFKQQAAMIPARSLAFQQNTVGSGPEKKNLDSDLTGATGIALPVGLTTWSPTISLLNGVAQGATEITRVGRKIQMTKLSFYWTAQLGAATTGGCSIRFRVVYDKQANGALPAITQVFLADNFHSPNNLANADRFITLVDEITPPLDADNNQQVSGQITRRLNLETMFSGATNGIASITSGSIYLFVSQSGGALASSPSFMLYPRIRFIDI